jgi:probable phosphoglycerate mutase
MLIYFVRHGHPDYENDSLTEMGTFQAEAAAKRLANSGIQEVYSSPQGRAYQTAEHVYY